VVALVSRLQSQNNLLTAQNKQLNNELCELRDQLEGLRALMQNSDNQILFGSPLLGAEQWEDAAQLQRRFALR